MSQCDLKLIVGLGNPDRNLLKTRHNVGFWFVDELVAVFSQNFNFIKKYESDFSEISASNKKITIMKPLSYINNSGIPIKNYFKNSNLTPDNILVVYDDLDLDVGQIRIKYSGSSGGHNGLNSIIENIQTKDFWRLRIGIDKPEHKEKTVSYVLGKPSPHDSDRINNSISDMITQKEDLLSGNFSKLMNLNNRRNK